MSDEHKAALAAGRKHSNAVRRYLEAIAGSGHTDRRPDPEIISAELDRISAAMSTADPLTRLQLVQLRSNLEEEMSKTRAEPAIANLEAAFIESAPQYSENKGISYEAWIEVGVAPAVLASAGIVRQRKRTTFFFDDDLEYGEGDEPISLVGLDPIAAVQALLGPADHPPRDDE